MDYFRSARGFLGRMAGPSLDQRLTQINNNKIANFRARKVRNNAKDVFDTLNKKTKLDLIKVYSRSTIPVSTNVIQGFIEQQNVLRGRTNYANVGRKAAAAIDVAARRGALGAGVLAAAPVGLTAATIGGLGYTGYQGGRAAAAAARAAAAAASKKYGNVKNIVSAKYGQLSGRNTNKRVANLSARVIKLEAQVRSMTNAAQKANQMMRLNNYKKLPNTTGLYKN